MSKYKTVLEEVLGKEVEQLSEESHFQEMDNWDSMNHIFLITRLEETYGIQFTGDEIAEMTSIKEILKCLKSHDVEA